MRALMLRHDLLSILFFFFFIDFASDYVITPSRLHFTVTASSLSISFTSLFDFSCHYYYIRRHIFDIITLILLLLRCHYAIRDTPLRHCRCADDAIIGCHAIRHRHIRHFRLDAADAFAMAPPLLPSDSCHDAMLMITTLLLMLMMIFLSFITLMR